MTGVFQARQAWSHGHHYTLHPSAMVANGFFVDEADSGHAEASGGVRRGDPGAGYPYDHHNDRDHDRDRRSGHRDAAVRPCCTTFFKSLLGPPSGAEVYLLVSKMLG